MKLLERYIARLMAGLFFTLLGSLVALFLAIDFGDWLRLYAGKPIADVAALYWYRSHLALVQFAPAALVLASGLAVAVVRRRGEWTALRALGASPATVVRPLFLVSAMVAIGLLGFQELVVSRSGPSVDRLMVERFGRWGDFLSVYLPRRWFRAGDSLVNVRGEADQQGLSNVRLFRMGASSELVGWIEAGRLTFLGEGRWRADDASELRFSGPLAEAGRNGTFELELPLRPEVTLLAVGRAEWLPFQVLHGQISLMEALELPTEPTRFAMHHRWAAPVAMVLAAMFACMLGLRSRRQASVPRALLEGAGLYGGLFLWGMISRSLAINGGMEPSLAAWLAPLTMSGLLWVAWRSAQGQRR